MKKLNIVLTIILGVFFITACGTSSTDNEKIYATISAKDFYDNMDTDFYRDYINKKITITNLTVDENDPTFIHYQILFTVLCDNAGELTSSKKENVSITGTVADSDLQNGRYLVMNNCSIE